MLNVNSLIAFPWLLFLAYWLASRLYEAAARTSKRVVKRPPFLTGRAPNIFLYIALILLFFDFGLTHTVLGVRFLPNGPIAATVGFAVCLAGILFAIWARMYLGGNWSGTPAIKKDQALVKTGPYAMVRNPIYTGITIGVVGSAISVGTVSGLIAIVCAVIFSVFRIATEERMLKEKFGKAYEEYCNEVKAFVPGVW